MSEQTEIKSSNRAARDELSAREAITYFNPMEEAFLTTVETPEPRYVVVCFPILLALAAQLFARRSDSPAL